MNRRGVLRLLGCVMDSRSVKDFFFRLIRPNFWHQNHPTNHDYSDALESQIDNGAEIVVEDKYCIFLGDVRVWVGNYPYGFGYQYPADEGARFLPSARVRQKLKRRLPKKPPPISRPINPWGELHG